MGRVTINVPDVGEGIAEVELVSWAVSDGDEVTRNQVVAEVMTDKATVEVPAPSDGVVGGLAGNAGDVLLVGSPLFILQTEGEDTVDVDTEGTVDDDDGTDDVIEAAERAATTLDASAQPPTAPTPPRPEGRRPTATPAVRRRARDGGIDLRAVTGTGPAGRVTHEDLDAVFARSAEPTGAATTGPSPGGGSRAGHGLRPADDGHDDTPIIGIRRRIAEQMVSSMTTIPHITYVEEVDITALEELRSTLNRGRTGSQPKLTLLPFLVRALVNHLPAFPQMNAHVLDPQAGEPAVLRRFGAVHVGVAAQTEVGLVVPVLRHAGTHTVWSAAARIGELADRAKAGTASPADLTGSTITISSLGAAGGLVTTPVINKPETTIIGVNKMSVVPKWVDGGFVPRTVMNLSSSFDHRVIDGWDAAQFIQAVKQSLEQPALLFIDQPDQPTEGPT